MKKIVSAILVMTLFLSMLPSAVLTVSAETVATKTVGDLDRDGEITDWDGVLLARHLAGWAVSVKDEKILDIDGDGEITDWDGVMFDRHLAGWSVVTQVGKRMTYTITYENTKDAVNTNPASYENGGTSVALTPLEAEHYTFAGWYIGDNKVTHIPTDGEGDLTITARWTPVEYTISYTNTKGAAHDNPQKYNIESPDISLLTLGCNGYRFDGWYNGNEKITVIPTGTTGDITLTAQWTACDYTITYENTKGAINNNPNGFNTDSAAITLTDLEKEGYTFDGWYNGNAKVTTIPSGTVGNITLTAQWTPISYTATFTADGSIVATRYFTIEDSVISNIPNVPSKAGYTGAWSNYSLGTSNVVIPAVYTLNEYTITYANTKGAENSNPDNYTVITSTFQLSALQCDGYDFIGWYKGSTKITSIEKGTTGNITLTAKWSPVDYVITYTDTKGTTNTNPVEYDVETGTIYLTGLVAEHYTFDGWYWNGRKVTSIPAGNIGDIELVARWTPVSYNLTYQNTKGATNTNPTSYTVEDMIILQDIRADGYTFEGWYIGDEKITAIPVGSYGNKTLTAKWTPVTYSITYNDEKNLSHNNPATYTADSDTITLAPLSADGYTFDGWYSGSQKVTTIPAGSTGDLVLTAKWSVVSYKITYKNTKSATNGNPATYTIEDTINLSNISSSGYTFDGWYDGDTKVTQIVASTFGDLTLTAKWTPIVYSFTFYGVDDAVNPNALTTTTIETWPGDYTLQDPSRSGYRFDGWVIQTKNGLMIPVTTINWARIKGYNNNGTLYIRANWTELTIIKTAEDFAQIAYNPGGAYQLKTSIYIDATICDSLNPFSGYFDGNNCTIYGKQPFDVITGTVTRVKTQKALATENKGYISYCVGSDGLVQTNSGTIKFSGSNAGYVYTSQYSNGAYDCVAGLVGTNTETGEIIGCYSKTEIGKNYAVKANSAGGLVGRNEGLIENSYFNGYLRIERTYPQAAGLVGYGYGTIRNCYAAGNVYIVATPTGTGPYANSAFGITAGLVADLGHTIENSFSCMYATAGVSVGGSCTTVNTYYASDMCSYAWATHDYYEVSASGTGGKTGTGTFSSNLKSTTFVQNTLGWNTEYWTFENGNLPKLAWE